MNIKAAFVALPLVLAIASGSLKASPVTFTESACSVSIVDKPCLFSTEGVQYDLTPQGRLHKSAPGGSDSTLQLPFTGVTVDRVSFARYGQDLILICGLDDGESGAGLIVRLDPKLTVMWHLQFPTFNLSTGALEDHFLYQAGFGAIAKVDLERGVFLWKHEGLYDRKLRTFNAFREPEMGEMEVVFREKIEPKETRSARSIHVNKITGQMQIE